MRKNKFILASLVLFVTLSFAAASANAGKPSEYEIVVKHLKTKYKAKKVKIPFLWLARFAVGVVRPAGVKSFSVTLFEDLKMSRAGMDSELAAALDRTFTEEWSPVFRIRSREGQQAYMYMREAGKSVRLTLVTIDKQKAAIIRATFSPEKLAEFVNDPKIFGISLSDEKKPEVQPARSPEITAAPKADNPK